jgi:hypothetical protein
MRVIVSSIPRAKALSKALRHLLAAEGLTIRDGEAKAALAAMLGYASWAELRPTASPYRRTGRFPAMPCCGW